MVQQTQAVGAVKRMSIRALWKLAGSCLALACLVPPSFAHHSFAAFNMDQTLSISGTVKDFEWTNPHCWIVLQVLGSDGTSSEWRFEGAPQVMLSRGGWSEDSLHAGDRITINYHPRRDGTHGGGFQSITLPDGRSIGMGGPGPGSAPAASPPQGSAP
jgi:Family of unknown function (DUF6152)